MATQTGSNGAADANGKVSYAGMHNLADHFIGGNRLENAPASKVKDFVAQNDGHTVITNVSYPLVVVQGVKTLAHSKMAVLI
jgi:acetyl-CoA carboxylase/biotin carboxylase 1